MKINLETSLGAYSLVYLREQDLMDIKDWRNDQIKILRQKQPLTEQDQHNYYTNIVLPSKAADEPDIILFSFLLSQKCIGYGGLTNIDWQNRRAEVSFLMDTVISQELERYCSDFAVFLSMLKIISFERLNLHRLYTETFDLRNHHIEVLESQSFVLEGRLRDHVLVEGVYNDALIHGFVNEELGCI